MDHALCALIEENFYAAEQLIDDLEDKLSVTSIMLLRGYLSLSSQNYAQADIYFEKALFSTHEKGKSQEILEALALNKFCQNHYAELAAVLENGLHTPFHYPLNSKHIAFFKGALAYSRGCFQEAVDQFTQYTEKRSDVAKMCWLDHIMDKKLPASWFATRIGCCHLKSGDLDKAMTAFEPLVEKEQNPLAAHYLGLCHLQQCRTIEDEAKREAEYKLALFYLEKPKNNSDLSKEDNDSNLADLLRDEIVVLLSNENPEKWAFAKWAFASISILEKWGADKQIASIAKTFAQKCLENGLVLHQLPMRKGQTPLFCAQINEKIAECFYNRIKTEKPQKLVELWDVFAKTAFSYPKVRTHIAQLLEEKLLDELLQDSPTLSTTNDYLQLWKKVNGAQGGQSALSSKLIHQGKLFWLREGEEMRGTQLFQIALTLCPKKERIDQIIDLERFFTNLYTAAESANMVHRLARVYDAVEKLDLDSLALCPQGSAANYLADATYFFKSRNYSLAKINAQLVLKVEPKNQQALRLFGLSNYHLGEYAEAIVALKKMELLDEQCEKTLMLSLSLTVSKEEKQLVQVETLDELQEN